MAVTTTNLGVITAYGDAVAAGYTGTKAEWQALMASYATVGQQAVDAKNDAVAAKNTAVSKATEATTAANTATTKASEASASAQSIAQSAAQIQENTDSIDQLKSDFADMESDGVVPSAEQILTDKGITDSVPYHYRKTGGDGADRLYDQIVGGTVNFNQLINANIVIPQQTHNGITISASGDGRISLSGTNTNIFSHVIGTFGADIVQNHVYYAALSNLVSLNSGDIFNVGALVKSLRFGFLEKAESNKSTKGLDVTFRTDDTTRVMSGTYVPQVFDLTAMFGTTIADYVYSLETTTAGAGVAWLKAHFPRIFNAGYVPYNAGELVSVQASAHKMTGFNQWDGTYEAGKGILPDGSVVSRSGRNLSDYICVIPNTAYYLMNVLTGRMGMSFALYDADKTFITADGTNGPVGLDVVSFELTIPSNCCYLRIVIPDSALTSTCINLSDPAKNGTYEPYKAHSYPLDSTLTLRGIPKLVDGMVCFDGDVYDYTGKVTRNTILRAYQSGDESLANAITDGTNTVVYSANASTEQADPYQHLQQCDPNGTEEYVSTGIVPVGHNSFYPENLRAKVEGLPWNFASLIAPTESAFVATRNYTTGALFIVNNVLYKATSNIANGGTITPNTNCAATTLAEIIIALA